MLSLLLDDGVLTCTVCRGATEQGLRNVPLALDVIHVADARGEPLQAMLRCPHCGTRFPVIDGIACIFADTRAWLRREERAVMGRTDLDGALAAFLAQAWGESEDPSWRRQLLAVYGRRLPGMQPSGVAQDVMAPMLAASEAAVAGARDRMMNAVGAGGRILDAGCSVGVDSLALAGAGAHVVAFDQDFSALRTLSRLLREGAVEVPAWGAGGSDFGRQTATLPDPSMAKRLALVAGDVLNPPFAGAVFDGAMARNLLDNVAEPVTAVRQLHGILRPGGRLCLASPFDWAERATARSARFGDGLRLPDGKTDAVPVLHALLEGRLPRWAPELSFQIERVEDVPWVLVRHDRSAHVFVSHQVEAIRTVS